MWLLLVGSGYNAIARVEGVPSYQVFVYPGVVVMAALFGAMLTAIATVYDREAAITLRAIAQGARDAGGGGSDYLALMGRLLQMNRASERPGGAAASGADPASGDGGAGSGTGGSTIILP